MEQDRKEKLTNLNLITDDKVIMGLRKDIFPINGVRTTGQLDTNKASKHKPHTQDTHRGIVGLDDCVVIMTL